MKRKVRRKVKRKVRRKVRSEGGRSGGALPKTRTPHLGCGEKTS